MATMRNDTLSAQIIDARYLPCTLNESPNLCFGWQKQHVAVAAVTITSLLVIVALSTYQLCSKNSKIRSDIKCISLTYLYCVLIANIFQFMVALVILEPLGDLGWEWSDNGWTYEEETPGWQWLANNPPHQAKNEGRAGDWVYNDNGSWQWNVDGDGGWYFDTSYRSEIDAIDIILYICIFLGFATGSCAQIFAYLYPFKRLVHSFHGTQYQIQKNFMNAHYFNAAIIFFLAAIGCAVHMFGDLFTSFRMFMAASAFTCVGLLVITYQFNKRLMDIISSQVVEQDEQKADAPKKENGIELNAYQNTLLYLVTKHSTLTGVLLGISVVLFIENIIIHFLEDSSENDIASVAWGTSQMYQFAAKSIGELSMSVIIFLGFSSNAALYEKLCFFCHRKCNNYCNKIAKEKTMERQTELQTTVTSMPSIERTDTTTTTVTTKPITTPATPTTTVTVSSK